MSIQYHFTTNQPDSAPQKKESTIEPAWADAVRIVHNQHEVILDFFQEKVLQKRIVTSPEQMKALLNSLGANIEAFEEDHGEIRLPKRKQPSMVSELRQNLYRDHKVGKNLRIINPTRKKSETKRKKR